MRSIVMLNEPPGRCRQRRPGRLRALAVAVALAAMASPAVAEPLAAALARAYRGNPQLGAERARQRSDDEAVPQALAGFFPTVSASAGIGPTYEKDKGSKATLTQPLTLGLTVNQTVYDAGRTAASVSGAESAVFGGRATLRGVEQTVLLLAVMAYMDVLRDTALIELQRGNLDALRETLRIARRRYELGDTRRTDAAQAESRVARAQADLATAEANLVGSRGAYRQAIGAEPRDLVFPDAVGGKLPPSLRAAVASAMQHHPAIRAAIHAVDVAASAIKVAQSDLRPNISVQGTLQRVFGGSGDDTGTTPPISVGPQINVPIYDGGLASATVRQAKETLGQRRIELETARDQVRADLRSSWGALDAAEAAIAAGEAGVAANEVALAGVRREQLEGQRTILDVLNAQQELLNSRTNLVVARRDRVVASYSALGASGGLSAARLGLKGPLYRPETHYHQVRDLRTGKRTPDGR